MTLKDFIIDPKDAQRILIGASGTLGPMEFAQGLVAIVAASIVMQLLGLVLGGLGGLWTLINLIVGVFLAFCWICIFSKRFHDAGKSGWLAAAAAAAGIVGSIILSMILVPVFAGGAMMTAQSSPLGAMVMTPGMILANILISVIVNGALGYYMFRLPSKAV